MFIGIIFYIGSSDFILGDNEIIVESDVEEIRNSSDILTEAESLIAKNILIEDLYYQNSEYFKTFKSNGLNLKSNNEFEWNFISNYDGRIEILTENSTYEINDQICISYSVENFAKVGKYSYIEKLDIVNVKFFCDCSLNDIDLKLVKINLVFLKDFNPRTNLNYDKVFEVLTFN